MTKVISTTSTNTNKTRTLEKENEKYIFMIALSLIYAMILAATFWIPLNKSMTFIQIFSVHTVNTGPPVFSKATLVLQF